MILTIYCQIISEKFIESCLKYGNNQPFQYHYANKYHYRAKIEHPHLWKLLAQKYSDWA